MSVIVLKVCSEQLLFFVWNIISVFCFRDKNGVHGCRTLAMAFLPWVIANMNTLTRYFLGIIIVFSRFLFCYLIKIFWNRLGR